MPDRNRNREILFTLCLKMGIFGRSDGRLTCRFGTVRSPACATEGTPGRPRRPALRERVYGAVSSCPLSSNSGPLCRMRLPIACEIPNWPSMLWMVVAPTVCEMITLPLQL